MPNEQALYNGLQAIKIATKKEETHMHTLIVRNPVAIRLNAEERKNLKEVNAPSPRLQELLYEMTVQRRMNEQQVNAFMPVFTYRISLIQGPPGTGKTFMAACIVEAFFEIGDKMVVTSGSNTAIDNVATKITR